MVFAICNLSYPVIYKQINPYVRYYSFKRTYKLLFFGSDSIALSSFRKVNEFRKNENNYINRLDLVTTDSFKHRTEIIKYAETENIRTIPWPLNDLRTGEYDLGLIVAFGHLIKADLLNKFPLKNENNYINRLDLVTTDSFKHRTEIIKYAETENIRTIPWPLNDLRTGEYDLGLIVAFGHLIKADLLNKFPLGMVNVHPSLLPRWRGAAPIIHTLLHGDQVAGVTLMKIKADIFDVGEIISQQKVPITKDIMLPELTAQLSELGAEMLVDCLRTLPDSLENAQPQSKEGVTYAKKIHKCISEVRWSEMTAIEVYNLHRAIYGLYPLTTKFKEKQMKLFDAFINSAEEVEQANKPVGVIEFCHKTNSIRVLCKDRKYVHFRSLRIVGKRQITALDFFNGYIKNTPVDKRDLIVFRNK